MLPPNNPNNLYNPYMPMPLSPSAYDTANQTQATQTTLAIAGHSQYGPPLAQLQQPFNPSFHSASYAPMPPSMVNAPAIGTAPQYPQLQTQAPLPSLICATNRVQAFNPRLSKCAECHIKLIDQYTQHADLTIQKHDLEHPSQTQNQPSNHSLDPLLNPAFNSTVVSARSLQINKLENDIQVLLKNINQTMQEFLTEIQNIISQPNVDPATITGAFIYKLLIYKMDIEKKSLDAAKLNPSSSSRPNSLDNTSEIAQLKNLFQMDFQELQTNMQKLGDAQSIHQALQNMFLVEEFNEIQQMYQAYQNSQTSQTFQTSQTSQMDQFFSTENTSFNPNPNPNPNPNLDLGLSPNFGANSSFINLSQGVAPNINPSQAHSAAAPFPNIPDMPDMPNMIDIPLMSEISTTPAATLIPGNQLQPMQSQIEENSTPREYSVQSTTPSFWIEPSQGDNTQVNPRFVSYASLIQKQTQSAQGASTSTAPPSSRRSKKRKLTEVGNLSQSNASRKRLAKANEPAVLLEGQRDGLEIARAFINNPIQKIPVIMRMTAMASDLKEQGARTFVKKIFTAFFEYEGNEKGFDEAISKIFSKITEFNQQNKDSDIEKIQLISYADVKSCFEMIKEEFIEHKAYYLNGNQAYITGVVEVLHQFLHWMKKEGALSYADIQMIQQLRQNKIAHTKPRANIPPDHKVKIIKFILTKYSIVRNLKTIAENSQEEGFEYNERAYQRVFTDFINEQIQHMKDQNLTLTQVYQAVGEKYGMTDIGSLNLIKNAMYYNKNWKRIVINNS